MFCFVLCGISPFIAEPDLINNKCASWEVKRRRFKVKQNTVSPRHRMTCKNDNLIWWTITFLLGILTIFYGIYNVIFWMLYLNSYFQICSWYLSYPAGIQTTAKICVCVGSSVHEVCSKKKDKYEKILNWLLNTQNEKMDGTTFFWTKNKKNSLVDMLHVDGSIIFYPIPQIRLQGLSNKLIFSNILKTSMCHFVYNT